MKTFFFTTFFRLLVITGGWIYLSSYQANLLHDTLGVMNPATEAVNTCLSGVDTLSGDIHQKLDNILLSLGSGSTSTGVTNNSTGTDSISDLEPENIKVIDNDSTTNSTTTTQ